MSTSGNFFKEKKLSADKLLMIQRAQCKAVSTGVIPISAFESEPLCSFLDSLVSVLVPGQQIIATQIKTPARTLTRVSEDKNSETKEKIRSLAGKIGDSLAFSLYFDHQFRSTPSERNEGNKKLGVLLGYTDENLNRCYYVLGYRTCFSSSKDETLPTLEQILEVSFEFLRDNLNF